MSGPFLMVMNPPSMLPSWRPGPTRDAVLAFLAAAGTLPVEARVAAFDNDGTLWCEKPAYPQLAFCVHELGKAVAADPSLAEYLLGWRAELGLDAMCSDSWRWQEWAATNKV